MVERAQSVVGHHRRLLGDADGALALHVGMAAHRADAGALPADVAAQEQQVRHHLAGLDALAMLRQPPCHRYRSRPSSAYRSQLPVRGRHERARRRAPAPPSRSRAPTCRNPRTRWCAPQRTRRRSARPRTRRLRPVVLGEDRLAQAVDRGDVAAALHLQVLRRDQFALVEHQLDGILRVGEALEPALAQRIEGDDRATAPARLLQLVQHPRRVRADVLAEEEDAVAMLEIVEIDGADRLADRFRQRDRGRLVAHVRGIGEVVGAVDTAEESVHVRGFE